MNNSQITKAKATITKQDKMEFKGLQEPNRNGFLLTLV